jgi:hypothetical protein
VSWFGSVQASGYVFDEALLGRDELVRRVLARWVDGARLGRLGSRWFLVGLAVHRVDTRTAVGAPLVHVGARWVQTPLSDDALARLPADSVTEVLHGALVTHALSELEAIDPSTLVELPLPAVAPTLALARPPPPFVAAKPATPTVQTVFGDMLAQHGVRAPPVAVPEAEAPGFFERLTGAVREFFRAPPARPAQPLPAPRPEGPGVFARLAEALRGFFGDGPARPALPATRGAAPAPPGPAQEPLLDRLRRAMRPLLDAARARQKKYLDDLKEQFAGGNLDEALRRAIPLNNNPQPGPLAPPGLGIPGRRDQLTLLAAPGRGSSVDLGDGVYEQLRAMYRAAYEQLLAQGKIDEAAYVLAHLLREPTSAVALLEKHKRFELAAKLAGLQNLAVTEQIRLWLLAKKPAEAVRLARAHNAFAATVAMLEPRLPGLATELRLAWAQTLAERGRYADAIEATAPVDDVPSREGWVERALEAGGASAATALAVDLRRREGPEGVELTTQRIERLLERDANSLLAQTTARAVLRHASTRSAPPLYRGLWRRLMHGAGEGHQMDPALVEKVLTAANDPVLRADAVPPVKWAAQPERGNHHPHVPTPGEVGTLAVRDLAELPKNRRVLALGTAGLRVVGPEGATLRHHLFKADALVVGPVGVPVLVLSVDAELVRVARLDPYTFALTDWFQSSKFNRSTGSLVFARDYDGLAWAVSMEDALVLLDTHADAPTEWWRVPTEVLRELQAGEGVVLTNDKSFDWTSYDVAAQRAKGTHAAGLSVGVVDGEVRTWRLLQPDHAERRLELTGRGFPLANGVWRMNATAHGLVGVRTVGEFGDVWLFDWHERWSQVLLRLPGAHSVHVRALSQNVLAVGDSLGRLFDIDLVTHAVSERART